MATNRAIEALFDARNVLDVVDVAVSKQEQLQIDPARIDPVAGTLRRIKQNRAFRRRDEIAVGLENTAAKRLVGHPKILDERLKASQRTLRNSPMPGSGRLPGKILNVSAGRLSHPLTCRFPPVVCV